MQMSRELGLKTGDRLILLVLAVRAASCYGNRVRRTLNELGADTGIYKGGLIAGLRRLHDARLISIHKRGRANEYCVLVSHTDRSRRNGPSEAPKHARSRPTQRGPAPAQSQDRTKPRLVVVNNRES